MKDIKKISNFIERDLTKKILEDNWDYKIGLERDFEHSIFYHIQNFLKAERLDKKFRMATNYSIYGTDIMKINKKNELTKNKFVMPDIVIRNIPKKESEQDKLYIAMELKNLEPDEPGHDNAIFTDRRITNDFRKLNGLIQEKQIDRGYFCYLYFDEKQSNNQVKKQIRKTRFSDPGGKNKRKLDSSIIPITINRYYDLENKKVNKKQIEDLHEYYKGTYKYHKDGRPTSDVSGTHTKAEYTTAKRSRAGRQAWERNMYKPDWHVEMIKKRQTTKSRQLLGLDPDLAKKVKKKLVSSSLKIPVWLKDILRA